MTMQYTLSGVTLAFALRLMFLNADLSLVSSADWALGSRSAYAPALLSSLLILMSDRAAEDAAMEVR